MAAEHEGDPISEQDDEDDEDLDIDSLSESDHDFNYGPAVPEEQVDDFERLMRERRSIDHSSVLNPEFRHLAICMNTRRNVPNSAIGLASSYIDTDKTGDYDPEEEQRKIRAKKKQRSQHSKSSSVDKETILSSTPSGNDVFMVTLSFKKDDSITYLRSISEPLSQTETISDVFDDATSSSDEEAGSFSVGKPRRKYRARNQTYKVLERGDGLTLADLTDDHSQRRGCKACFLSGNDECSLIEPGTPYPCAECANGSHDCEFIVPPTLKKSCLGCKRRKSKCSYKFNGGKGVNKCEECDELDEPCCAPPLEVDSKYAKRFEDIPTVLPPPLFERMFTACQQCRNAQPIKSCSLKNKSKIGPCASCKKIGEDCKFVLPGPRQISILEEKAATNKAKAKEAKLKILADRNKNTNYKNKQAHIRGPRLQSIPSESLGSKRRKKSAPKTTHAPSNITNGIKHITIITAFAHPITFNHEPSPTDPCSWCSSPFFGLYGHGEIKVKVIPYGGSTGNIEVSEGHYKSGRADCSKMCVDCTFTKLRVITCKPHRIKAMTDIDQRSFDVNALNRSLQALNVGDAEAGELARTTKWCSICASVAYYSCCRTQNFSATGVENPDRASSSPLPDYVGCGLHLCKICHWTFGRIQKNKSRECTLDIIGQLVDTRKEELWRWRGDEVRADCEFLTRDGEMMTRLMEVAKEVAG